MIVSSGAIGMGLHRMELEALVGGKKRAMGEKQALAAIGQGRLIALWDQLFGMLKQPVAQILMTRNDIADVSSPLALVWRSDELMDGMFAEVEVSERYDDVIDLVEYGCDTHHQ